MKSNIIPQGDLLRQLLTKSSLSDSNINKLLREKGVFIGNSSKNTTVPMLMKSLISPNDFDVLYDAQKIKDETIKYRTATVKCTADFNFGKILNEEIPLHDLITAKYTYKPTYDVIGSPSFYYENENHAILEFEIEKENQLDGLYNGKTKHKGSLSLMKDSNNGVQISVQQNSTSKDTFEINNILFSVLKERLKANSFIETDDDIYIIKFNHFNNRNRVLFFYSFTNNFSIYTTFKSLTDIDLFLDEKVESHPDVKSFLNDIESLKVKGTDLKNHLLLKKAKYYDKLILGSLKLRYKVNYQGIEAEAIISMGFPEYVRYKDTDAEFQISIDLILDKPKRNHHNETSIRKKLLEVFEHKKIQSYNQFKTI